MRDDKHGAPGHQRVHAALHDSLGARVNGAGCLVHDHHRRVGHGSPRDGEKLALALAEFRAVAVQHGIVAVRQAADEVVCAGELRRGDVFSSRASRLPVADILHYCAGKEIGVLQYNAQTVAQVLLFDLVDIDPVIRGFCRR